MKILNGEKMTKSNLNDYRELFEFRNVVEKIVITFPEVKRLHKDAVMSPHNMHVVDQTIKF
jgi:hypothetical protein